MLRAHANSSGRSRVPLKSEIASFAHCASFATSRVKESHSADTRSVAFELGPEGRARHRRVSRFHLHAAKLEDPYRVDTGWGWCPEFTSV